jgi:CheY-like chemotaxis protein
MTATKTRASILVVEDDPGVLEALCDFLELTGFTVLAARHGAEALELLTKSPKPCMILLDLQMPTMDGWEFRRRQKAIPQIAGIPVIVISATNGTRQIDASMILHKPVNVDRLIEAIGQYC